MKQLVNSGTAKVRSSVSAQQSAVRSASVAAAHKYVRGSLTLIKRYLAGMEPVRGKFTGRLMAYGVARDLAREAGRRDEVKRAIYELYKSQSIRARNNAHLLTRFAKLCFPGETATGYNRIAKILHYAKKNRLTGAALFDQLQSDGYSIVEAPPSKNRRDQSLPQKLPPARAQAPARAQGSRELLGSLPPRPRLPLPPRRRPIVPPSPLTMAEEKKGDSV